MSSESKLSEALKTSSRKTANSKISRRSSSYLLFWPKGSEEVHISLFQSRKKEVKIRKGKLGTASFGASHAAETAKT